MQGHYLIWQLTFCPILVLASKLWRGNVCKTWDLKKIICILSGLEEYVNNNLTFWLIFTF